jgi:hypothetical protein
MAPRGNWSRVGGVSVAGGGYERNNSGGRTSRDGCHLEVARRRNLLARTLPVTTDFSGSWTDILEVLESILYSSPLPVSVASN